MDYLTKIEFMHAEQKSRQDKDLRSDNDKKRNSLVKEFTETTTAHGIRRATDFNNGRFRRGFWILVLLAMLSALVYTVVLQLVCMLSYPTITQQSIGFRNKLLFPAVTLCNLNQFRKSAFANEKVMKLMLLTPSDPTTLANINWTDSMWNFTIPENVFINKFKGFGHPLPETLTKCAWGMKTYNCSDIFVTQKTDFGMCFTFNGMTSGNFTPRESVHRGSKYGLTVIFNIQQDEYLLGASSDAAGILVTLHDPSETPLVDGKGFDVSPGTATKAIIKMTEVTSLPPPYRSHLNTQCEDTARKDYNHDLQLFDRYDMYACIYECRYNYIQKACGCRTIFDRGNDRLCHPRYIAECYNPHLEKFTQEEMYKDCSCPIPCKMKLFDAEVSASAYPSSALMEQVSEVNNINISESKFRENYLKLTLAYDRFTVDEIKQVPEFTFESIMGTLGGQLGIFIGASMISILEFFEFGMEILVSKVFLLNRKPKSSENN